MNELSTTRKVNYISVFVQNLQCDLGKITVISRDSLNVLPSIFLKKTLPRCATTVALNGHFVHLSHGKPNVI